MLTWCRIAVSCLWHVGRGVCMPYCEIWNFRRYFHPHCSFKTV